MKKYKIKLGREQFQAIKQIVWHCVYETVPTDFENALHLAVLFELENAMDNRLSDKFKTSFKLTLNPVQSLALLILFNALLDGDNDFSQYWTIIVLKIRNELLQMYPLNEHYYEQ